MNGSRAIDRTLGWSLLGLLGVFLLFEVTPLDLWVQDHFYDFATRRWLVDAHSPLPRALFYTGPKLVIIALGVGLLALALGPRRWREKLALPASARPLWVAFLALACIPSFVGFLKQSTNIFFPSQIRRYGGTVAYVRVLERFDESDKPARSGKGWPAGHASGGFALFALVGLARTRRAQTGLFILVNVVGWSMGLYQVFKGAHYLSHTFVTAFIAWIVFLLLRRLLGAHAKDDPARGGSTEATKAPS